MIIMCMTTIKNKVRICPFIYCFVLYCLLHAATKTMPGKTFLPGNFLNRSLKEGK